MKKVLLVGELNQTVSSVNKHLSTKFQTQICKDMLELVKGMIKVFDPDLILICLVGIGELDADILELLKDKYSNLPVLLIGTKEECRYYEEIYAGWQFEFAIRPITLSAIMQTLFHTFGRVVDF